MKCPEKTEKTNFSFDDKTAENENFKLYSFIKESIKIVKPIQAGFRILKKIKTKTVWMAVNKTQPFLEQKV